MESKVYDFKIKEDILFLYKFDITTVQPNTAVNIMFEEFGKNGVDTFQCELPQPKSILMKMIGGWVRNHIWYKLSFPYTDRMKDYEHDFKFPQADKDLRKIKQFTYLRSRRIAAVLGGLIWKQWLSTSSIDIEVMKDIDCIAFRLQPGKKNNRMGWAFESLYRCALNLNPDVWSLVRSDFKKYNTSLCKYLLHRLRNQDLQHVTKQEYIQFIQAAPDVVKKCRYGFEWGDMDDSVHLSSIPAPQTRWQWFAMRTSLLNRQFESSKAQMDELTSKLSTSDIKVWHYFKKAYRINKPYSTNQIHHMLRVLFDGNNLYTRYKDNSYGIPLVPVEGSIMRMVRNAVYNHRQEEQLNKKRALDKRDYLLPVPQFQLPDWMETLRLKTANEMISAGMDCHHCIGSYTYSNDTFLRSGNICLQIYRHNLEIGQCYDEHDQITKASEAFKKKVNKALEPLREQMLCLK